MLNEIELGYLVIAIMALLVVTLALSRRNARDNARSQELLRS